LKNISENKNNDYKNNEEIKPKENTQIQEENFGDN
jgi:hypothetical protein